MRQTVLVMSLLLAALTAHAQIVIPRTDVPKKLLVWEHTGTGVSWWQVCRPVPTCDTPIVPVVSTTIPAVTEGMKVFTYPLPATLPDGVAVDLTVRACNDKQTPTCVAATAMSVKVTPAPLAPPVNLRILDIPTEPPPIDPPPPPAARNGTYNGSAVALALREDSVYRGAGLDGSDMGADAYQVMLATCGVVEGVPCSETLDPRDYIRNLPEMKLAVR